MRCDHVLMHADCMNPYDFVLAAKREAGKRLAREPYKDGDRLMFSGGLGLTKVSDDFDTQVRYVELRLRGESHNFAEMIACKAFPATRTDREFQHGRVNGNQFESKPGLGDWYRHLAEQAGVSTTGKYYSHGLASYPGDPTAWVSDRGDVLRVAEAKGFKVSGAVEYQPPEREAMPDVVLADDILEGVVDDVMARDPGWNRADVKEQMYDRLSGREDNNELLVKDPVADF